MITTKKMMMMMIYTKVYEDSCCHKQIFTSICTGYFVAALSFGLARLMSFTSPLNLRGLI